MKFIRNIQSRWVSRLCLVALGMALGAMCCWVVLKAQSLNRVHSASSSTDPRFNSRIRLLGERPPSAEDSPRTNSSRLIEIHSDEMILPNQAARDLNISLVSQTPSQLTPRVQKFLNITEEEKHHLEKAIEDSLSRLKTLEYQAAKAVSDLGGEDTLVEGSEIVTVSDLGKGKHILIEARESEGNQERTRLMAQIEETLGPKRASLINALLDSERLFNRFLRQPQAISISELRTEEGAVRHYFNKHTVTDGKLDGGGSRSINETRFNDYQERWGHLLQIPYPVTDPLP